jgi:two-component system phosphate regulon sensor histidine kinase PhoR
MPDIKAGMVISVKNNNFSFKTDTLHFENRILHEGPGSQIIQLLYGVDSLQDSLRLPEITSAYAAAMKQQKLDVPFIITRLDSCAAEKEDGFNTATVGFAKPVTYKIKLGNTFPYLFRQITQPVLFSILLLGITVLSFFLLYKNLTKQRKLAELKNEFISNITHELKTPIATVGVAIEALKNFNAMDDPKRTREYLDISQHELQRLGLLVDKVLKLSMFEKKEMDMRYEAVNLKDIVNEVVESMRLQVEKYRATITTAYDGDTTLVGDRLHLLSVVFNLLDNALKYSKEDPAIRISLEENEGTVKLIITDNGIGIAEEYKDKIFEKFFRVPHGNTHNAKGYGLGLSYVSGVVEKHRGSISVESKPGAGTSFIITLPKQQA